MSLAEFLRQNTDLIVDESERFARTLPSLLAETDVRTLRNHLPLVLQAVALDLEQPQSRLQQAHKSEGRGPTLPGESAAQVHGRLRAESGLSIEEVISEYRLLRASVLRLWDDAGGLKEPGATVEVIRFNEAIDQAIAESVIVYSEKVDRWRQTLLAVIGHDLRSPVSAVKLTIQALRRATDGSLENYLTRMTKGVDRIAELLDSLLDYNTAKLGSGMSLRRRQTDLGAACREEIELLRAALPRAVIEFDVSGDTAGAFDDVRMREALSNMVANAHQYQTPATPIAVRVDGQGEEVELMVRNEGPALPPNAVAKLFDPFQRGGAGEYRGTRRNLGLGLFVVREIALAHGGNVMAESADGYVTFTMRVSK